jgi:hypothetical protein
MRASAQQKSVENSVNITSRADAHTSHGGGGVGSGGGAEGHGFARRQSSGMPGPNYSSFNADMDNGMTSNGAANMTAHSKKASYATLETPTQLSMSMQNVSDIFGHGRSISEVTGRHELLSGILIELQRQNEFIERLLMVEQDERAELDEELMVTSSKVLSVRMDSDNQDENDRSVIDENLGLNGSRLRKDNID